MRTRKFAFEINWPLTTMMKLKDKPQGTHIRHILNKWNWINVNKTCSKKWMKFSNSEMVKILDILAHNFFQYCHPAQNQPQISFSVLWNCLPSRLLYNDFVYNQLLYLGSLGDGDNVNNPRIRLQQQQQQPRVEQITQPLVLGN